MAVLTQRRLEDALYEVACMCLGIDPDSEPAQSYVRISWPVGGSSSPAWTREENICFLRVTPYRDSYTHLQESRYGVDADGTFHEAVAYTRCYQALFICYGPNAMDHADAIRAGILRDSVRTHLRRKYNLSPLPHIDEPIRADELENGEWWGRCDLTVLFYQGVERQYDATPIEQAPEIRYIRGG